MVTWLRHGSTKTWTHSCLLWHQVLNPYVPRPPPGPSTRTNKYCDGPGATVSQLQQSSVERLVQGCRVIHSRQHHTQVAEVGLKPRSSPDLPKGLDAYVPGS